MLLSELKIFLRLPHVQGNRKRRNKREYVQSLNKSNGWNDAEAILE